MPLETTVTAPRDDSDAAPAPGAQCGRYIVERKLGAGGNGIVVAAHDPILDRKVALKLLHRRGGQSAADDDALLEIEAQAMARLAHPNVVTVYEVDRVDDRVFVAMELVVGATLRGWLAERPRAWREIVEMFISAGRGLAAAHAAGLVHRDFKPDNVLIGGDGRPRVSDFGLVCETSEDSAPLADTLPQGDDETRGSIVGTPAYMSPEQWTGRIVDARGDQFAFCVALWEALYRRRPFQGSNRLELGAAIQAGAIVGPPRRPRVPRRLQAALRRGLTVDPAARWPDMPALLDELERTTAARRRRTLVAIAAAVALGSAAIALAVSARLTPEPCAPPTARVDAVWGPARRTALAGKLTAADPAQGAPRLAKIASALDLGAQGFGAMYVEACRATRVEGRQSDTLLDRRMDCLDRWLAELASTVHVIEQAGDPVAVDHAVRAATSLSPLSACADTRALDELTPPPDPARRSQAALLARRIQELEVDQRARKLEGLGARARDLVAAARVLDHAPTLSAALAVQASVDFTIGDQAAAEPVLRELVQVAARARDDRRSAFAWSNLITSAARDRGKPDEAKALFPVAEAAVLRAGDPPDLRANLLYYEGVVVDEGPRPGGGLALLVEARRVLEAAGATVPGSPLASRLADVVLASATSHARLGDDPAAIASYRDAIERWRSVYGNDSPDEAFGWHNLGATLQQAGKLDDALDAYRTAARIRQARLGDTPVLAGTFRAIASVLNEQGKWADAVAMLDRAMRIAQAQPPGNPLLASVTISRSMALVHLGRLDEAAQGFDDALAMLERAGSKNLDVPVALYNRAKLRSERGRCDAALPDYARSIALFEELRGPTTWRLIFALVGQGMCLVWTGHAADAIPPLERALAIPSTPSDAYFVALGRVYLGRARVETRRDVAGGLAMIQAERATLAADVQAAALLRELDAWLARRR